MRDTMTAEQIRERNLTIAIYAGVAHRRKSSNFDGYKFNIPYGHKPPNSISFSETTAYLLKHSDSLHYHDRWDWLMPVIQKLYRHDVIYAVSEEEVKASIPYEPIEFIFAKVYNWIVKINNNEGLK